MKLVSRIHIRTLRYVSAICVWLGLGAVAFETSAADASQVAEGATLYALRCSGCHGEQLRNLSGGWSFDLRRLRPDEHDRFVESVTNGKDNMPSWYGVLKIQEIDAIWAYIRATVDK
jgi:mono/diheme cytochrome c family protein